MSSSRARSEIGRLRASLKALRDGDLAAWKPLPATTTAAQVQSAAADGGPGPGQEWLFGQPATTWHLPPSAAAPFGVVVWLQGDLATLVEVRDPKPRVAPEAALGPPDAVLPSGLGPSQEQRLWPSRGLTLHVQRISGRITRLYGHEPSTADAMARSPLVDVRLERRPLEP